MGGRLCGRPAKVLSIMTDTAPRGTRIAHVGLAAVALDQILPFYRDILGMPEVPLDDADGAESPVSLPENR